MRITVPRQIVAALLAAAMATACGKPALRLTPLAEVPPRLCADGLPPLTAGTSVLVEATERDIEGQVVSADSGHMLVRSDGRTLDLAADDIQRVVQLGHLRSATYAKRGLLIGIALGVLEGLAVKTHQLEWSMYVAANAGAWFAAIGAIEGTAIRDGVVVCD
jgi:uncharacterized protein (DUF849 family)